MATLAMFRRKWLRTILVALAIAFVMIVALSGKNNRISSVLD